MYILLLKALYPLKIGYYNTLLLYFITICYLLKGEYRDIGFVGCRGSRYS